MQEKQQHALVPESAESEQLAAAQTAQAKAMAAHAEASGAARPEEPKEPSLAEPSAEVRDEVVENTETLPGNGHTHLAGAYQADLQGQTVSPPEPSLSRGGSPGESAHSLYGDLPWLKHYDSGVPASVRYRNVPLYNWLDEAAEQSPRILACRFFNTKLSYGQLRKQAEILAANLRAFGVMPGDRVGIMLPNLPQTMVAFWGVLKAGAVVTMVNPLYMEKELLHQVKDSGLKHLITIDLCWPKLEALQDRLGIDQYFITTIADSLGFPLNLFQRLKSCRDKSAKSVPYNGRTIHRFTRLLRGRARFSCPVPRPEKTLALLQYTGGTTGMSKGAALTHYNLGANIQQTEAVLHFLKQKTQIILAVVPFFHVYGLNTCLILPTLLRATTVTLPRFVPSELLAAIDKYRVTVLPGAPAIYISLLQQRKAKKKYSLQTLKVCISGSAPMPVESLRRFEEELGATIVEGYGLSEASPITHLNPARGGRRVGSIGLPLPDTEARIVDMEVGAVTLPPGKVGELVIRGPQVMGEYWNNPDESAGTMRNGWLYTGDIAVMDEDGYFTILDRKKDMIIVGGYNVSPREIDEVLYEHPRIAEAVAVGVPHSSRGEIIKVYIVPGEGETLTRVEVMSWCRQRLANYKVPRQVEFRAELPKSLVGKILRRTLRLEEESKLAAKRAGEGEKDAPARDAAE